MPETNIEKSRRGNSFQRVLKYLMDLCKELGYISSFEQNYKIGMPGYDDQNQFKAPYKIGFEDGTEWLLFTTTSLRDRIKEQYWDSFNIKQLNSKITNSYLVFPDNLDYTDRKSFESKNNKIQSHGEYSSLNALVSQEKLFNLIEAYALKSLPESSQRAKKGLNFEKWVASTLSNQCNLEKWKTNDPSLEGLHYNLFTSVLNVFELDPLKVKNIYSTSDKDIIGRLPNGGDVKTDILTKVTFDDDTVKYYTISSKKSSRSSVSIHQRHSETFADVLDKNNAELRRVLSEFQRCGNKKDMDPHDTTILEEKIHKYIHALCEWAVTGIGEKVDNPATQYAKYILFYNIKDSSFTIHTSDYYCKKLELDCSRAFGTPFSWSYQGERGTNIQLTAPIYQED